MEPVGSPPADQRSGSGSPLRFGRNEERRTHRHRRTGDERGRIPHPRAGRRHPAHLPDRDGERPGRLAAKIASDQSTGTFVAAAGRDAGAQGPRRGARRRDPRAAAGRRSVLSAGARRGPPYRRAEADIDFPLDAVGTDLAALMTIAIGGVYSIKGLSGIRVVGLQLPPAFGTAHPGPQFGTPGTPQAHGRLRPADHRLDRQAGARPAARTRRPRW